jgi:PKD repeat protein
MKKYFTIVITLCSFWSWSQEIHPCGQVRAMGDFFKRHPEERAAAAAARMQLEEYTRSFSQNRGGGMTIYTIPVVFHIVHNNGTENIDNSQIYDAVNILNRDFRLQNADTMSIVDAFDQLAADIGIEFRLATKDPNGNCTNGITRTVSDLTYIGDDQVKDLIMWPRNKYLNVWVCQSANGAAGYTNLPENVAGVWGAGNDGIMMRSDYVGSIGTSATSRSRTLTHEVGHWLNLMHTWGDSNEPGLASNCDMDDGVDDTPNTIGWTTCSLTGATCGNVVDNVQNYMEYSYCSRMFTQGQAVRMRAALTSSVAQRNQLITASNLLNTGVTNPTLCDVNFSSQKVVVCVGDSVGFVDLSYNVPTQWNWNFGDGSTLSGNTPGVHQNPYHTYTAPGVYNVALTASNTTGSMTETKNALITVYEPGSLTLPIWDGFEESQINSARWTRWNEQGDEGLVISANAAYTGNQSLYLQNVSADVSGTRDAIISAPFSFSNEDTAYVSFKWAWANRTDNTNDVLRVSASGNCGETWTVLRTKQGVSNLPTAPDNNGNFIPTGTDQWDADVITITNSAYFNDQFQLKFEFTGKGGNNLYIDDINVYGPDGMSVLETAHSLDIHAYPNPSEETMKIELSGWASGNCQLQLIDASGRLVWQGNKTSQLGSDNITEIPHHAAGVYLLQVNNEHFRATKRIIFK